MALAGSSCSVDGAGLHDSTATTNTTVPTSSKRTFSCKAWRTWPDKKTSSTPILAKPTALSKPRKCFCGL